MAVAARPIYCTRFAPALLAAKLRLRAGAPKMPINVVPPGGRITLGPFELEFVPVAHSIPESNALAIRTPVGLVVHTGDWKIDPTPVIGLPTDEKRLRELGDEGVLALICDSTNVMRDGTLARARPMSPPSSPNWCKAAGPRRRHHLRLERRPPARRRRGRHGRPARGRRRRPRHGPRHRGRARIGYLDGIPAFRGADIYGYLPPRQGAWRCCTGSQGEPRAALSRIAADDHPEIAPGRATA